MRGKRDKSGGLGRALVRMHNQMVKQSKEKSHSLHLHQRKVLESVTEISDIDAVVEQAEEAALLYSADNPAPTLCIDLDGSRVTTEERRRLRKRQKEEEALYASSLRVPRRPPWNSRMSAEELDVKERQAFLVWRRSLARLEENEKLVITPFEKNIDIWRQLWRVLERSDLLVMVVDARDPLFYRCPDLEAYAQEIDKHKRTLLLVNKADLLPSSERKKWAKYFTSKGILFLFWSAKSASATVEGKKRDEDQPGKESSLSDLDTKIYGRDELLGRLQAEAKAIATSQKDSTESGTNGGSSFLDAASKHVVVGFVGYPNVGKSSTINALVGLKRTGVTSTPGKTKHFQTLIISDELILCDCPGLVFPSFTSSRYEMIASGVLPVDRMTEHREAVQVVADNVSRDLLEKIYNIKLPIPKPYEPQSRPPTAAELLRSYCLSRGHVSSSGLPDEARAARQILKDFIDGKILHFKLPPDAAGDEGGEGEEEEESDDAESDESESNEEVSPSLVGSAGFQERKLEHIFGDLESFELSGGAVSNKAGAVGRRKKAQSSKDKNHKKPQRRKDRSWRVGNDGGDGMPVVRVFEKPAVNWAAIRAST
ncbi:LOW QUALITY PROTEIN: GTPase LSG1-1-like [Phalaenopsis equestris]|uniref:LOW QUALITY PROTEIN: GTPase LSG1-1-like n=1 Tax=Phalaenopsis equestris TaxID=78828 RepID=UPI0009E3F9A1|nr:LOW QUALITY PROTEIN: GTPase LSG1-1-like [Phalaenopsis equestris]